MFRLVTIIFLFLTSLIDGQFLALIVPHYENHNYSPATATILQTAILKDNNNYQPFILYEYNLDNKIYKSHVIQSSKTLIYKNLKDAQSFISSYYANQSITVYYDPKNFSDVVIFKGLTPKDTSSLLTILPLNIAAALCLMLAFFYRWEFEGNNVPMNSFLFGLWGSVISSMIGSVVLIFAFKLEVESATQFSFLMSYLLIGVGFFIYRLMSSSSGHKKHRYKRVYKSRDYDVLADEFQFKNPLHTLRHQELLPLVMIDALMVLGVVFNWVSNQFIMNNTSYIIIISTGIFNLIYFLSLAKKHKIVSHNHSITTLN